MGMWERSINKSKRSFFVQIIGGIKAANPKNSTEAGEHAGSSSEMLFNVLIVC